MEPTAKSSQKPAINDTSLLACLPEPVLELVLAAAGPRARMRSARCSRGVQDAALLPDKYWRAAYAQRWWHARALAAPQAAGAFAARVKGERLCCDLLVARVCCSAGMMVGAPQPGLQGSLIPIPVEKDEPFPGAPPSRPGPW